MMNDQPCTCDAPGKCPRFGTTMSARTHALCQSDAEFRRRFALRERPTVEKTSTPTEQMPRRPRGGPGTELKRLLSSLGLKESAGCGCASKANQMDLWGVEGCQEHRSEIIDWLAKQQKRSGWLETIQAAARAVASGLATKINPFDLPGSLLDLALERARSARIDEANSSKI